MNEEIKVKDLPEEICIGQYKLKKYNKRISPSNDLNYIKWFRYKIIDNNIEGYKSVNLMFFRVDEKIYKESIKSIVKDGIGVASHKESHVDGKTGNIHPSKESIKLQYNCIEQLVLCVGDANDPGPNTGYNGYLYPVVHNTCYFPLINNKDEYKEDPRYLFLKKVAKEINEKNPDILSKEIIEEIKK